MIFLKINLDGGNIDDQEKAVKLTDKGVSGILNCSKERECNVSVRKGDYVYVKCRSSFCNKKTIEQDRRKRVSEDGTASASASPVKRRSQASFKFNDAVSYADLK